MFKYFLFAVVCLASAAAAPGYLGGLGGPSLPLAAAPAISYGHALAAPAYSHGLTAPSYASYGLAPRISYAAPALAHAPLAAPAISAYGLGPRLSYASPALAHAPLGLAHGPLGLSHGPLGLAHGPLGSPLGLGYKSLVGPSLAAPAYGLAHGW
ncbi:cuticle protein 12.5 isoform X1 [Drosophila subobscura]|uniref:cuticle protein 12.5 isoform X1 n=1 Tax=Drosophila subobscura TaxID=7241 RepID=UPI00155AE2B6|nr:cuticle protein 12.5 isoform X1 [Drosophila subobscura]